MAEAAGFPGIVHNKQTTNERVPKNNNEEHVQSCGTKSGVCLKRRILKIKNVLDKGYNSAGAVPVITDTSSARDDVADGYNGYIVPIGDVDGIVDRVCYLYHHRELLEMMGERARQTILRQNADNDLMGMWDQILKR